MDENIQVIEFVKRALKNKMDLSTENINRIIEMAWEDRTPFDAIENQFGLSEKEVIELMRRNMKASSWRMWRARVQGRSTKHTALRDKAITRFKCDRQRQVSRNAIAKRVRK